MIRLYWVKYFFLAAVLATGASAASVQYNMFFTGGSPTPATGSFTYDTTAGSFTQFNITWNNTNFNLLPSVNQPVTQNSCPFANAALIFTTLTSGATCNGLPLLKQWAVFAPNPPGNVFTSSLDLHLFNSQSQGYVVGAADPDSSFVATPTSGSFTVAPVGVGLEFYPVAPCRLVDTGVPSFQSGFGPPSLVAGNTRSFAIPANNSCGIPQTAAAYSLNITAVTHGYLGALTIWPAGQPMPNVSTLNSYSTGSTAVANAAIVPAGTLGAINTYATDATDLVVDVDGYFDLPLNTGLEFYPVTPCRLVDTRLPSMQTGFGSPSMTAGTTRSFPIPSNTSCVIPTTAAAYSLNITAVPRTTLGILSIWPTGNSQPNVSTLNVYNPGTVVANAAIVPAGTLGSINAYVTDETDLVIDIDGYFAPASINGLKFYAATPCRIADTRVSLFPSGLGPPLMTAGSIRSFPVPSGTCNIPPTAGAYSVNFTALPQAPQLGIFITWPTGVLRPNVSTMNSYNGSVVSNAALVPAGTNGAISVYVTDATNVLFDINGYFAP